MTNIIKSNTYTNDEYFKLVVISKLQDDAIENCKWLTGCTSKLHRNDIIRTKYKKTHLITYPRYKGEVQNLETKAFEGVVIFTESEDEFQHMKPIISEIYGSFNVKMLVSNNENAENWAKECNLRFHKRENPLEIIEFLDKADQDEYEFINQKFNLYDADKSGFISSEEMPAMIESLGVKVDLELLKRAILAFDTNHDGKISIGEFMSWWKLGRRDPFAFEKFYELQKFCKKQLKKILVVEKVEQILLDDEIGKSKKLTSTNINLDTKNLEEYLTRFNIKTCIGGESRREACKNYLSRYNDKMDFNDDYFIEFAVFIKSMSIDGMNAKDLIESFKNEIIDKIDSQVIPGFKTFISNFLVVKVFNQDFSVNVRFEIKYDVQELLKTALIDYLTLSGWLTNDGTIPLNFEIKYFCGKPLSDLINENSNVFDLLEICDLKLKFSAIRDKIKSLVQSLDPQYKELVDFITPFVISTNLNLKFEGVPDFTDTKLKKLLDSKNTLLFDGFNFIKRNIPLDLRKIMSRLEVGANIVDTFFSIQIFSEDQWE